MNIDLLLRGYTRCEVQTGQPQTVDRIPRGDLRDPIVRVRLTYFSSELKKTPLLPWQRPVVTTIWIIRAVCTLTDGRKLYYDSAREGAVADALDYAYLRAVQQVLQTEITHKQGILKARA